MKEIKVGQRFGYLTVLGFSHTYKYKDFYKCKCDCGNEIVVYKYHLLNGHTNSCGCYHKERAKEAKTIHGLSRKRIEVIYRGMRTRCYNKRSKFYKYYGRRGIGICKEWLNDNTIFFKWAFENGYKDNLTIDRIDNTKDYSPENCRWTTMKEQDRNKSNNIYIEYKGKRKLLLDWCEELNLDYFITLKRYKSKKYSIEEIFSLENFKNKKPT